MATGTMTEPCLHDVRAGQWRVGNREAPNPLFGLVRLETEISSARPVSNAAIEVRFGPASAQLDFTELSHKLGDNRWSLTFHVNSHLIPDGRQELRTAILWSDGTRAPLPSAAFVVDNAGELAARVRSDLQAHCTPVIFGRIVDSGLFPYETGKAKAWFDQPSIESDVPLSSQPSATPREAQLHLIKWGFAVLPDVVPRKTVERLNAEVDKAIADGTLNYRPGSSDRILFTHRLPHGRKVWLFPPVMDFLRAWFQDEPCACQTLYYLNGSEQNAHQDTIHLTPFPAGYMCGVWVSLEDVRADSGELFVYPGSHRAPRLLATPLELHKVVADDYSHYVKFDAEVFRLIETGEYQRLLYRPKAGQILVWHENLIHGGHVRMDRSITRRSIVSHYFARGSVAFYDSRGEAAALASLSRMADVD
jgi:hypothetical protein